MTTRWARLAIALGTLVVVPACGDDTDAAMQGLAAGAAGSAGDASAEATPQDAGQDASQDPAPEGQADATPEAPSDVAQEQQPDAGPQEPTCTGAWGTSWYVRTDGGDATQCTGKTNAPYPGSGTSQDCAFRHPFIVLPPTGAPLLQPGDRLVIGKGDYRMGFGATDATGCYQAGAWECRMPAIPSGLSAAQPTCIVGEGWNDGCPSAPELFGVERAYAVLDLTGSQHVRVECLELTDRLGCVEFHSGGLACNRDTPPFGEWSGTGLLATDSSDVTLRNVDIHGMAHTGIWAGRLTDWTLDRVRISANGWVGFDGDVAGEDDNAGTTTFRHVEISWNGCGETYPGQEPVGCWGQSAGGYGDGLGTGSTGGTWVFEDCDISHNTSDGLDMLYHDQGGTVQIDRLRAEGNAGNQVKVRGETSITNSLLVGNCAFFHGKPFTHNVDDCRALGSTVAIEFHDATQFSIVNTTMYSEGDCLMAVGSDCPTGSELLSRNNIFLGATDYLQPFEHTCFFYSECAGLTFDQDYGVVNGTKHDGQCPWGPNDLCADPQLVGPFTGDAFGMQPQTASPAVNSGLGVGQSGVPSVDILGHPRPAGGGVDRGAYELQ